MNNVMRAITLTQPWATLVAVGAKRIETRSWGTAYRGPLAIHAAKGANREAREFARAEPALSILQRHGYNTWEQLPRGVFVARCELIDVVPIVSHRDDASTERYITIDEDDLVRVWHPGGELAGAQVHVGESDPWATEQEFAFGDYTPGRYGWLLDNVRHMSPIDCRGALGLWRIPVELEAVFA